MDHSGARGGTLRLSIDLPFQTAQAAQVGEAGFQVLHILNRHKLAATWATDTFDHPLIHKLLSSPPPHEVAVLGSRLVGTETSSFTQSLVRTLMAAGGSGLAPKTLALTSGVQVDSHLRLLAKHGFRTLRGYHERPARSPSAAHAQKVRFGIVCVPVSVSLSSTQRWSLRKPATRARRALATLREPGSLIHLAVDLARTDRGSLASDLDELLKQYKQVQPEVDGTLCLEQDSSPGGRRTATPSGRSILRAA